MDKNRIKKGLLNAAPYMAAAAIQVPYLFSDGGWFNGAMLLTNAGVSYVLYRAGVSKYDREMFVKTPLCQEYLGLYNEFVDDVVKMYEDLGIDPGLDSVVAYRLCLENGIFSHDGTDKYATYEDDKDIFIALLGGRVTTGAHCCRHSASLFSDINNRMKKGLSPKISVYMGPEFSKKLRLKPNHLVSGLVHKNKKLLYDSTASLESLFDNGLLYIGDDSVLGRRVAQNVSGSKYTFAPDGYDNRRPFVTDTYEQFMELESVKDSSELVDDFMEAILTGAVHMRDFYDFHEEEKTKILQLSNLNKIIIPHGKEIVREKRDLTDN